jgi:hypothetical protein
VPGLGHGSTQYDAQAATYMEDQGRRAME